MVVGQKSAQGFLDHLGNGPADHSQGPDIHGITQFVPRDVAVFQGSSNGFRKRRQIQTVILAAVRRHDPAGPGPRHHAQSGPLHASEMEEGLTYRFELHHIADANQARTTERHVEDCVFSGQ
jgi:hypothetical protein